MGNPTDMYGGSVISISTQERARCEILASSRLTLAAGAMRAVARSRADLEPRSDLLDLPRAALRYFRIDPATARIEIRLSTDIPMQAGLAGSTALVVALVGALDRLYGWGYNPWKIAETARRIEAREMRVTCGFQDQHMAVFGGLNYMDFAGKESLEQREDEPLATVEPLAPYAPPIPLLAANTGVRHDSGVVHSSPRARWVAGDTRVRSAYARIAGLARLAKRALLEGNWPALGELMSENHRLVADLGGSGEANERLIQAALRAGALGAKLAGAGGGGTILVLAEDSERVRRALLEAGAVSLWTPAPSSGLQASGSAETEP